MTETISLNAPACSADKNHSTFRIHQSFAHDAGITAELALIARFFLYFEGFFPLKYSK
jgi:hypothetical protein